MGSFRFRGLLNVGDRTNIVRLLVVRDKNQDDTVFTPGSAFFFDGVTLATGVNAQINTRNVDVLMDPTYNLQDTTESVPATRPQSYFLDFNIPIRKELTYNQQTSGDAPILPRNMRHYYFIGVSDSVILPNPSISGSTITWFKNVK